MRLFISILLIALLSYAAEFYFAWWMIALVAFLVALFAGLKPAGAFVAGFTGIALLWLCVAAMHDLPNNHILSQRMADVIFKTPNHALLLILTVLIGGLVGGMAGWSGSLVRRIF